MCQHCRLSLLVCAVITLGCDNQSAPPPAKKSPVVAKSRTPSPPPAAVTKKPAPPRQRNDDAPRLATITTAEGQAVKKIAKAIEASLDLGPTLVIWLFDRTPSAQEIVANVAAAALDYYQSPELKNALSGDANLLLTTAVAFDQEVAFLLDPPTSDFGQIKSVLAAIPQASTGAERPFTALQQALEKFLPLRTQDRRELIVVLVTDEAGDDGDAFEPLVETTRRQAIPVYCIGLPAPWGQSNPFAADPKAISKSSDDSTPTVGPESVLSERVDIENWTAHHATSANLDLIDSGFGPWALERLCRASRGQFFALRPGLGYGYRGVDARTWPNGDELRFEEQVVSRYAPDYIPIADYQKLLGENKARAALTEAAKLSKIKIDGTPGSRFAKTAEAKMAKQLTSAQQFAASNSPRVDRLYEILISGESDRAKLTSPRWQAQYDLALGRALANKARLDGYNSMLAALKRGKLFQNPDSKEWLLEPADHFETESTIQRMADKAKTLLQRVTLDHAGTPWATIAAEELKLPLGWRWTEK